MKGGKKKRQTFGQISLSMKFHPSDIEFKMETIQAEPVLHLLDTYHVSDTFYHELTQHVKCPCLPRSYRVIQRRSELNGEVAESIRPSDGNRKGAQRSFNEALTEIIQKKVCHVYSNWSTIEV